MATQEKNRTAGAKTDIVVYASPEQYASFPAVFRTDSELVLAFMVQDLAPLRAAGRHPHYQDASASRWAVSHDHGFSWESCDQPLRVGRILDVACASPQMRHRGVVKHYAGAPLRDGGLVTLTGGRERPGYSFLEHHSIGAACVEDGRTPGLLRTYEVNDFGPFDNLACYSVVRSSGGALLAAGYAVYNPAGSARQKETVVFLQSADEGRSWSYLSHIANDYPFDFSEPGLLAGPNGQVTVVMRVDWDFVPDAERPADAWRRWLGEVDAWRKWRDEGNDWAYGYALYQADSSDGGRTWRAPVRLPLWGHPAHLTRLASGKVLMVYGHRRAPYTVRAILSHDGGRTWDADTLRTVQTFEPGGIDFGYPVATQLHDGSILCAYYGYSTADVTMWDSPHGIFVSIFDEQWLGGMQ